MRIIGIDPGSRITGYGVVDSDGVRSLYVASGCIHIKAERMAEKLGIIFTEVTRIVEDHKPDALSIEQVFMARNAASAIKLGHARGAAICAAVHYRLSVSEYSPRTIKQAIVGNGGAGKEQVQHMIRRLLKLDEEPAPDAADALAVALCHAHTMATLRRFPAHASAILGSS